MTTFERKQLVSLILEQAQAYAIENGSALTRTHDDRQGWAGVVQGMRRAATIVDEFQKEPEDEENQNG